MEYKLQNFKMQLSVSKIANVHYFEFLNDYHTKGDSHDFYELLYVDKGTIMVSSENFSGMLSANQLIIHQPNEVHSLTTLDTVAPNVIIIGFKCESDALIPFSKSPITLSTEQYRSLAKIMQEAMSIYEPPYDVPNTPFMKKRKVFPFGADQMLKITLEAFLISIVRGEKKEIGSIDSKNSTLENIEAVEKYISENYTAKISLDTLCFLFETNKTTLCKSFKKEYGKTVLNYINQLKINKAKSLLRNGKTSVTEISELVGFDSIHYFCRTFKKFTGQTPTEYSKSIKAKFSL